MTNPGVKTLAAEARTTLLEMANHCSIDMETWDRHSNAVLRLAHALSQPHSGCPERWRPISTAPKDGTNVVLFAQKNRSGKPRKSRNGCAAVVGHFEKGWGWLTTPGDHQANPTHWAPLLPEPPTP